MGIDVVFWKGPGVSVDALSWKVRRSVCNSGFGSKCTSCVDGFYVPEQQIYPRVTCLRSCEIQGCTKCSAKFYSECDECDDEHELTENGYCAKK